MSTKQLFLLFACLGSVAFAFQGTKVGIVDADTVIQSSERGKAFLKDLEAFSQAKRQELDIKQKELATFQKDLQTKVASMSAAKKADTQRKAEELVKNIKRLREDAQREAELKLKEGLDEIRKEMIPIIREVALEKDLDMVLNMGPQSQVVYFHDRINITQEVIKKYDTAVK